VALAAAGGGGRSGLLTRATSRAGQDSSPARSRRTALRQCWMPRMEQPPSMTETVRPPQTSSAFPLVRYLEALF